jgi:hypothetical protein
LAAAPSSAVVSPSGTAAWQHCSSPCGLTPRGARRSTPWQQHHPRYWPAPAALPEQQHSRTALSSTAALLPWRWRVHGGFSWSSRGAPTTGALACLACLALSCPCWGLRCAAGKALCCLLCCGLAPSALVGPLFASAWRRRSLASLCCLAPCCLPVALFRCSRCSGAASAVGVVGVVPGGGLFRVGGPCVLLRSLSGLCAVPACACGPSGCLLAAWSLRLLLLGGLPAGHRFGRGLVHPFAAVWSRAGGW